MTRDWRRKISEVKYIVDDCANARSNISHKNKPTHALRRERDVGNCRRCARLILNGHLLQLYNHLTNVIGFNETILLSPVQYILLDNGYFVPYH